MPLFNQSSIPWVSAVQRVADSASVSADAEMTTRAHHSLRAAFQFLGGKTRWDFLRVELTPQRVFAPFSVTGVSASAGVGSAAAPVGHGVEIDDVVAGSFFMLGARVSATGTNGFSFATALNLVTAAGVQVFDVTAVRDMYAAPTDMRNGYSVKLLSAQRPLRYLQRRGYDRGITDEFTAGTVEGYDFFNLGGKSKIRLLPPSQSADVLFQRYYRRFTIPPSVASASATGLALDIPEDYEEYPIAWAKWHFLTDKGEGRKEQATVWMSLAQDGIKTMLAEQTSIPDENLGFVPGHSPEAVSDRSTRWLEWTYS